jgi:hypothetical protein
MKRFDGPCQDSKVLILCPWMSTLLSLSSRSADWGSARGQRLVDRWSKCNVQMALRGSRWGARNSWLSLPGGDPAGRWVHRSSGQKPCFREEIWAREKAGAKEARNAPRKAVWEEWDGYRQWSWDSAVDREGCWQEHRSQACPVLPVERGLCSSMEGSVRSQCLRVVPSHGRSFCITWMNQWGPGFGTIRAREEKTGATKGGEGLLGPMNSITLAMLGRKDFSSTLLGSVLGPCELN